AASIEPLLEHNSGRARADLSIAELAENLWIGIDVSSHRDFANVSSNDIELSARKRRVSPPLVWVAERSVNLDRSTFWRVAGIAAKGLGLRQPCRPSMRRTCLTTRPSWRRCARSLLLSER